MAGVSIVTQNGCDSMNGDQLQVRNDFEEIHRADVARVTSETETIPVNVFATVKGTFRLEGKPIDFEVGAKPGTLSGNGSWETVVETANLNVAGVGVMGAQIYPDEPWSWHTVKASEEGQFSIEIHEKCETATIFIRLGDGQVISQAVSGLKQGETKTGVIIRSQ